MVAVGMAVLLCLAIWVGATWRLESLKLYFALLAANLLVWSCMAFLLDSYAVILPIILGALASLLLALAGGRAGWRAYAAGDRAQVFWVAGVIVALLPFALLAVIK
jgi:hypothetical protein